MPNTALVFQQLADQALAATDRRADAASALMTASALILEQDFGADRAMQIMLLAIGNGRSEILSGGLTVTPTCH